MGYALWLFGALAAGFATLLHVLWLESRECLSQQDDSTR